MRRREFITLAGGAAVSWPLAACEQQPDRMRRIGVLMSIAENDPEGQTRVQVFQQALQSLHWTVGDNLRIDYRWAAGDTDRMRAYAEELVATKPELIVANSPQVTAVLQEKTRTIPIVFVQIADPVGSRIVSSLAKPGGNVTGFASFRPEMGSKWLQILKEIAPSVTQVGVILEPEFSGYVAIAQVIETKAPEFGLVPNVARVHDAASIEQAINTFARESNGGLIVLPSPLSAVQRELIITLAAQHRLPTVYPYNYFTTSGGLVAYGIDTIDLYRRSAAYVDRILKGEMPGNLPVQQPTKFEFVINLKTAKALGLEVPQKLRAVADTVIE